MMKRDRIVENLRRRILSGEAPGGTRMPQADLAQQFDASITPVREALRLLEAEGLLESEPHRGVRVAGIGLDKAKVTYVVRRLVETYAMRRVTTRVSPRDLAQAHTLLDRMQLDTESGNLDAFRQGNRDFHFYFYGRSGIPALTEQIEGMWKAFPLDLTLSTVERARRSHQEHIAILEALESGDVDAVAAATEAHISQGFDTMARSLGASDAQAPGPFPLDAD
jgi:DNA-binding GntR family transcriptional regulator